jgi:hypothetical protein
MKWSKKFPTKAGNYWFYGYRYGKVSVGTPEKPIWMVLKVRKSGKGFMAIDSNGQFFYESEITDGRYAPLDMPEFPEVSEPFTESCKKCYGHGIDKSNGKTCPDCNGKGGR